VPRSKPDGGARPAAIGENSAGLIRPDRLDGDNGFARITKNSTTPHLADKMASASSMNPVLRDASVIHVGSVEHRCARFRRLETPTALGK